VKRAAHDRWKGSARVIGVNLTTSEGGVHVVRAYVENENIPYTVLLDADGTLQRAFGVRGTPTTVVLAPNGDVIDRRYGPMTRGWIDGAIRRALATSETQTESATETETGAR
jgi:peroxiredoxin